MKIKCPYCLVGFDNPTDLKCHIINENHKTLAATKYVDLLFKIHEKIESLSKQKPLLPSTIHNRAEFQRKMGALQELNSLLEGESI